jgi:hypothetical protein
MWNGISILKNGKNQDELNLLTWYDLLDKIIAYVKDESANMNTLTMTLTSTMLHSYLFNCMLAFVMAMLCLNDFSMWLIT